MDDYGHATEISTRFRDLDTNRHVNNAVYASYLEQARAEYFADVVGVPLAAAGVAMVELSIEFEAPITLDETVTVHTRVPRLGESSIPMEHVVAGDDGRAATAELTIVAFDSEAEQARPMPDEWREGIERHEGL